MFREIKKHLLDDKLFWQYAIPVCETLFIPYCKSQLPYIYEVWTKILTKREMC